jgi:hypothetical protein
LITCAFGYCLSRFAAALIPDGFTRDRQSWPALNDERVRVIGLTTPAAGQALVRLQSVAGVAASVTLRPAWSVSGAQLATFLGEPTGDLPVGADGITVPVAPYATTAVVLRR